MNNSSSRQRRSFFSQASLPEPARRLSSGNRTSQRSFLTPNTNVEGNRVQEVDDLSRPSSRSDSDYDASQSASSSPAHEEDSHDSPNNSNSSQTPDGDDWDVDNSLDSGAQSMQQPQPQPQPQPREDGAIPSSKDVFDFSFAPWDDIVETFCDVNKFTKTLQIESNRVKLFCNKLQEKLGVELGRSTRLSQTITALKSARQKTKLHVAKLQNSLSNESSECQRLLQNVETLEGQVMSLKSSNGRDMQNKEDEVQVLKKQLDHLRSQVADKERSVENIKTELSYAQKEVEHEKETRADLSRRLDEAQRKWELQCTEEDKKKFELLRKVEELTERSSVLQLANDCSSKEKGMLQAQISELDKKIVGLGAEGNEIQKQRHAIDEENKVLKQSIEDLNQKRECMLNELSNAHEENKSVVEAIQCFVNTILSLQANEKDGSIAVNALQGDIPQTHHGTKQLQAVMSHMFSQEEARRSLAFVEVWAKEIREVDTLRKVAIIELVKSVEDMWKEERENRDMKVRKKKKDVHESSDIGGDLSSCDRALTSVRLMIEEVLKVRERKEKELASKLKTLTQRATGAEKEADKYQKLLESLNAEHTETREKKKQEMQQAETAHAKEVSRVQTEQTKEMRSMKADHTKLMKSLKTEHAKEIRALKSELTKELKNANAQSANKIDSLRSEHDKSLSALQSALQTEKKKSEGTRQAGEKLKNALEDSRSQLECLKQESNQAKKTHDTRVAEESRRLQSVERELKNAQGSIQRLREESYNTAKMARESMEKLSKEKESKGQDLCKTVEDNKALQQRISDISAQRTDALNQVAQIRADIAKTTAAQKAVEDGINKEVLKWKSAHDKACTKVETVTNDLNEARNEVERLKVQQKNVESKSDSARASDGDTESKACRKTKKRISVKSAGKSRTSKRARAVKLPQARASSLTARTCRKKVDRNEGHHADEDEDEDWVWEKDAHL